MRIISMNDFKNVKKYIENGLNAMKKNNNEKAIEFFDKAIEINSSNPQAWNNKGVALRKIGKIEEAINCYNKALTIDPDLILAHLNKARALKIQKKFDLALFSYENILEIDPEHEEALAESERVRDLLARRSGIIKSETDQKDQFEEEKQLLDERKQELLEFLEESRKSINDSVERIKEMFTHGIRDEAEENRDRIVNALVNFNEQLHTRIHSITEEFTAIDFEEECRDIMDKWEYFKESKLSELKNFE